MHIEFVDQTLRDGQQSHWGMRMRAYEAAEALSDIARTGFRVVDLTGAGMFTVLLREYADDPWATTDFLVNGLRGNELRSGLRTISVIGFAHTPECIIDLWAQTLIKHGVTSFWLYDCLFDLPTMRRLSEVITAAGGTAVPAVMYGLTSVHDDAFFAAKAKEMASWPGTQTLYVEDAAGVLKPERAATLLPAIRAATGDIPLELHCHSTTGLAQHNYIEGMKAGFTWLHTASRPLANGVSLPSTESMVTVVEALGHTHSLDTDRFAPVAENFARAARAEGRPLGEVAEYDPRVYHHQVPGGMMGTLRNQLATHGMADRLPQVLDEIPRVRRELGEPIMATPFSQFVGIQAVLNVVTGDRYSMVPDEVVHYVLEHYGPLAAPVDPAVKDRVLSSPRARQLATWERPAPSLAEIRKRYAPGMSDEELLLRFMTSDEEVDRMQAAGPIRTDPRWASAAIVTELEDLIAERATLTSVSVSRPGLHVALSRRGQ
ncbi:carboxyltransferase [Pseudonocardia kujensis]|uniref:carboxyltransferase n=1 Tax=Pseudonocardia kujensis TaxID=1128675 RepID=UPI001E2B313A|nr:carboxyltransferase [Pseudonocardia kujensis]MCE0761979.1 carboxyltransferase [Pseudonocardia kujensis]